MFQDVNIQDLFLALNCIHQNKKIVFKFAYTLFLSKDNMPKKLKSLWLNLISETTFPLISKANLTALYEKGQIFEEPLKDKKP